ncbi:galactofuranosylgalactofuranosylrhamnosyl-N-acetylglucosaminyl-diphospho-decaprenol beta-1,5/1,6-galactofuranosyltransferase [Microbacterium sp. BE35]|uniref:glycosyltransferase n=1 Tax=Microbacterium sp. BE35 TaxID=2817773 RepID=UPI00286513FF|nr:glycosyltransferase [Microbacterium sp. BE35]MDR7189098.1 galactofuranosylgalactofuranosylrhamnosyl-N-acetylglucosaminyl-diphospho-decaprenol beta-1,5/1,6-galactofuranosyltransferase [Microbacterium sp. BE35]
MSESPASEGRRIVHRLTFPGDADPMALPLYADTRTAVSNPQASHAPSREERERVGGKSKEPQTLGPTMLATARKSLSRIERHSVTVAARSTVSFATYFNAFPAAYWRQWTDVDSVRLTVEIEGEAGVNVFRSTVRGSFRRVATEPDVTGVVEFDVSLKDFGDGGWLWFDLETGGASAKIVSAAWSVDERHARRKGTAAVSITTYNRPDDCVTQMELFAKSPDLLEVLDRLMIVDQGSKLVSEADGFGEAAAALGDKFTLLRQPNLGGSGGFARGMYEGTRATSADYVMLLDDDVVVETEGIVRAVAFADFCRTDTIVGGHMLNLYERSVLHSFGESVNLYRAMWHPVAESLESFDFNVKALRSDATLHRRIDVAYNGWWMCLIPRAAIERIGLSLPVFIKWDDAEYGLRASKQGIPTVSLPGAAVWHMPWTEKDDRLDWQAYYHQRNRWLVGLLYSPYRQGGALPRESFLADVKHLLTMQYSPVAMRVQALEDLLSGPAHLHETLEQRAAEMRGLHSSYPDGQVLRDVASYPAVARRKPTRKGRTPSAPASAPKWLLRAGTSAARNYVKPSSDWDLPEDRVASDEVRWWRFAGLDAALVSTADGTGASVYRRDRGEFRRLLRRSRQLHLELVRRWDDLAKEYQGALADVTSPEAWEHTFGIGEQPRP